MSGESAEEGPVAPRADCTVNVQTKGRSSSGRSNTPGGSEKCYAFTGAAAAPGGGARGRAGRDITPASGAPGTGSGGGFATPSPLSSGIRGVREPAVNRT